MTYKAIFDNVQNHLQMNGNRKIIVYSGKIYQRGSDLNQKGTSLKRLITT